MTSTDRNRTLTDRVASRYIEALELGRETYTAKGLKFHHWHGSLSITDMANAGKRGKKVRELWIRPNTNDDDRSVAIIQHAVQTTMHMTYDEAKAHLEKVQKEHPMEPGPNHWPTARPLFDLREDVHRGVDVEPMGTKINLEKKFPNGTIVKIDSSPYEFRVTNSTVISAPDKPADGMRNDTLYYSKDKIGGGAFYAWLRDNMSKASNMTIQDLQEVWRSLGIKYDFH